MQASHLGNASKQHASRFHCEEERFLPLYSSETIATSVAIHSRSCKDFTSLIGAVCASRAYNVENTRSYYTILPWVVGYLYSARWSEVAYGKYHRSPSLFFSLSLVNADQRFYQRLPRTELYCELRLDYASSRRVIGVVRRYCLRYR